MFWNRNLFSFFAFVFYIFCGLRLGSVRNIFLSFKSKLFCFRFVKNMLRGFISSSRSPHRSDINILHINDIFNADLLLALMKISFRGLLEIGEGFCSSVNVTCVLHLNVCFNERMIQDLLWMESVVGLFSWIACVHWRMYGDCELLHLHLQIFCRWSGWHLRCCLLEHCRNCSWIHHHHCHKSVHRQIRSIFVRKILSWRFRAVSCSLVRHRRDDCRRRIS